MSMAVDTQFHRRQVLASGQTNPGYIPMTLGASNALGGMPTVIEVKRRRGDVQRGRPRRNQASVTAFDNHGPISRMAAAAAINMAHPIFMTLGTNSLRRQKSSRGRRRLAHVMAMLTIDGLVSIVREIQRECLRRIDHGPRKPKGEQEKESAHHQLSAVN